MAIAVNSSMQEARWSRQCGLWLKARPVHYQFCHNLPDFAVFNIAVVFFTVSSLLEESRQRILKASECNFEDKTGGSTDTVYNL